MEGIEKEADSLTETTWRWIFDGENQVRATPSACSTRKDGSESPRGEQSAPRTKN